MALQLTPIMLVYRSLALGLLGACCLLLAMRPPITVVSHGPGQLVVLTQDGRRTPCPPPTLVAAPGPTIIDVAPGVTSAQLAELVRLAPGEYIATVDDHPVAGALAAGVALASLDLRTRTFVDLAIAGDHGSRRVLVLLH